MTQTFATSAANNDLYLGPDNNLVLLTGLSAVVQAVTNACLVQLGECVLEQDEGLPNFQTVWVGTPDYAFWQSYLQDTILAVDGVTAVNSISINPQNNTLNYTANISTEYGVTNVSGSISNG